VYVTSVSNSFTFSFLHKPQRGAKEKKSGKGRRKTQHTDGTTVTGKRKKKTYLGVDRFSTLT